ncbi:MAG: UvrD-helicase domain-containing protein [Phycisphaerae bacterium]|nr:UvrD-helicase domain-containing protein [Phycisphaerae bacterium]MBT6283116.1 UvrD-helicase domain-containing protein [Phycisphaerae bacterium]
MAEFNRVEIIQALAGSGKTQELAYRFLRLLMAEGGDGEKIDPKSILATTFSRKAAGEIRDRIIEMLSQAILDEVAFARLMLGVPEIKSQQDCYELLKTVVSSIHKLNIGTIDSFFVKTALAFSDTLEFTPGWSILDEVHKDKVFAHAVSMLTSGSGTAKQLADVLRFSKSGAKVPIFGTIEGIQNSAFIAARGTDESVWVWGEEQPTLSSEELEEAIQDFENVTPEPKSHQKAMNTAVLVIRAGEWKKFLVGGIAPKIIDGSLTYMTKSQIEDKVVAVYKPLIQQAFSVMVTRILLKNKNTFALMHALNGCLQEAKNHHGLYSFDDVTYQLSNSDVLDIDQLLELQFRMDGSIDHLLIDEFQDTSLTQWKVLEPIVQEINQSQDSRTLFFVGDVKQSLYGFRGGEPALLRGLESVLVEPNTKRLEASWRCTPPVLDLVNTIFENATSSDMLNSHSPDAVTTWMNDFLPHISAKPTALLKGYADIQTAGEASGNNTLQPSIDKVVEIASSIYEKAPMASIGILVRSNTKQQIQRIVHALRTNDVFVPASEFGGNPLTDSPAVTVILSALLMADDQCNSVHTFQVGTSPLGDYLGIQYPAREENVHAISKEIRRKLLRGGYAKLILEYAEQLVEQIDERDRLRLWQLVEFAESNAANTTLRPSEFVRLVRESPVSDPASSQVQVMTVHKSKGLSFDAVIVCDLDRAIWKSPDLMESHEDPCKDANLVGMYAADYLDDAIPEYAKMRKETCRGQVNDALCLLYVAMTRAKRALHLILPSRPTANQYYKKIDGLLLQILGAEKDQEPHKKVWVANGSDETWVDDFKGSLPVETHSIAPFVINPPTEKLSFGRGIATASPSSLEGGGKTKVSERFAGGTNVAFDRGTIFHKWVEDIEWFDGNIPSVDALIDSAPVQEASRLDDEVLKKIASDCHSALQKNELQKLLTKENGNVCVYLEQDFMLRVEKGTSFAEVIMQEPTDIRGSIDRLVVHSDEHGKVIRAEVIDWKSDVFENETIEQKIEHYAPQLATYRLAAAKLLNIHVEDVKAVLAFLIEEKIEDITDKASVECP